MEWIDAETVYTILHLLGVAVGVGGAFMSDVMFLTSTKDRVLDAGEMRMLKTGSVVTWVGLALLIISGILLFSTNPAGYLASSKFITKMLIVLALTLNGVVFHVVHIPKLEKLVGTKLSESPLFIKNSRTMYISGAISVVSWTLALVLGGLGMIPISVGVAMLIYLGLVVIAIVGSEVQRKKFLKS
jgi:hypothetical protein